MSDMKKTEVEISPLSWSAPKLEKLGTMRDVAGAGTSPGQTKQSAS